ncbi:MAG: KH domain-containing protein [Chloroflexi bacterium]|nr:KH domain-containing protein [Chloroflexota bacterium]MCI0816067.1 KH domain-containing protein [Chloroflexota bacterium]MCI0888774.1 KH domain-containing protein [Chloroflexota bacterium]
MKELVEYVARAIATHPDDVKVTEEVDEEGYVVLKLEVHEDDKGKVIGRQGRVAQAMRVLLRVAAVKQDVRVTLEIV